MNKETIKKAFREWKKVSGADYAITYPDNLGDCQSCVNAALCDKYGEESKGIWLKHWRHGMNAEKSINSLDYVYIAHDITEPQAVKIREVFGKYFHVVPENYDPYKCYALFDKCKPLFLVTWTDEDDEIPFADYYSDETEADSRVARLKERGADAYKTLIKKGVEV